ncbi:g3268 [Coccomyxa viridis]|uniref:G3268 protein n=1 Tax=Coccomyxa viridis TaxID=1274662 RepID=A0ABP1FUA9_9CHLO
METKRELKDLMAERRDQQFGLVKRKESEVAHGKVEETVKLHCGVPGKNIESLHQSCKESLPPIGWRFGELPRASIEIMLSEDLPARLKELLHVPPTLLRRLSAVKLRILVRL